MLNVTTDCLWSWGTMLYVAQWHHHFCCCFCHYCCTNTGIMTEVVTSSCVVWMHRRRSSLFRGQEQQDSHEFLRCILHYIQEAIRAISQQRALHHDVITSRSSSVDSNSHPSSASVAEILAEQSPQPDSVSPTAIASTMNEVFPTSPVQDCLISSSQPTSGSSHDLKPRVSNTSQSAASTTPYGAKRTSSVGKITNYFVAASPEPKTASELVVTTTKLADFVEAMYEGKIERSTRCSVCECSTRCTETFQDIEVVAQKAIIPVKASISDSFISDDDDDDNGEMCFCVGFLFSCSIFSHKYSIYGLCRLDRYSELDLVW